MSWIDVKPRLLIIPGLHGSPPDHWQTWLEKQHPSAARLRLTNWSQPDLDVWAAEIGRTLSEARGDQALQVSRCTVAEPSARARQLRPEPSPQVWLAVAHSFGCLALAHYLNQGGGGLDAALLVAPANPDRFHIPEGLLARRLALTSTTVISRNDPWMSVRDAQYYADRWGSTVVDAGEAGHINVDSGHGPWPLARQLVGEHIRRLEDAKQATQPRVASVLRFAT